MNVCSIHIIWGSQRANSTQIKMNYQCVQFHMDGHFNDKPSMLMSGDGCRHLPKKKTVFPS